ncbi:MAG: bifunctional diaminohydroxyphosphoribosylaminopyrimidine deaminase/5-amino-6-(5-phosphoribosylamino)uracil reductase RibD [Fimbriimonas ginsengisoli]|uniref:Riboflavin biosynthesis protein RibD n=1 Tax=Fimbriimonas ginsengisoli TaxID=1005039 RepID=A0A931PSH8_FIMGI|nr:bifunctional diaminohydroxyphosphoribosylaminopyrimidine deaminase/5-amino-6-(5-phosphoribosylamino)uracil reductase RibD [Fimbriimonas ginsengisoli]
MRRAIRLSKRGYPAPNPRVGCVIVRDGRIVGEGWHDACGGPHAEVVALEQAGSLARGASVYVTLEPCNHAGRTAPCSQALIHAGVGKVCFACPDPNPIAAGGGGALRTAGIAVEDGLLGDEARAANTRFLRAMELGRPYVVLKVAMSLDGRVTRGPGTERWITGELARREGHRLRAECGAVLVGRGTVEADNPRLTARLRGVRNQPLRVILDPAGRLSPDRRVFREAGSAWNVTGPGAGGDVEIGWASPGRLDLAGLLKRLFESGQTGLLVEGGPCTWASFLDAGLVDRIEMFVAPIVLGGGALWSEGLATSMAFRCLRVRRLGGDLQISLEPA